MKYHTFRLTPQAERAVSCVEDKDELKKQSIQELIRLKADLYGYGDISNSELIEQFNSLNRYPLRKFEEMKPHEKKIAKALEMLDIQARKKMMQIASNYKNRCPSEKKSDIHDLAFIFCNNGRNFERYPEVTIMNSEVSWYYHQEMFTQKKSFWSRFSGRSLGIF